MAVAYSELCQRHTVKEKKEFEVFVVETNTAKVEESSIRPASTPSPFHPCPCMIPKEWHCREIVVELDADARSNEARRRLSTTPHSCLFVNTPARAKGASLDLEQRGNNEGAGRPGLHMRLCAKSKVGM